ncbi:MAG TPA: MerR family transcriptional regulator, partial [Patescibacteria group bacterium]|nr:MerR family transcriptional regulator [Patescibacteria group bacterium]
MNPSRPAHSENLLSLQEAAQKLGVSVDTLLEWNEHRILKPTITPEGQLAYPEEQINQFLQIGTVGSVEEVSRPQAISSEKSQSKGLYKTLLSWIGNEFYEDEYIKDYLKSQVNDSLTFNFKKPSKKFGYSVSIILVILILILTTQQSKIKFLADKYQNQLATAENSKQAVLGAQTSKLKLTGSIIFSLPVINRDNVYLNKDLFVDGKSLFKGPITAPNIVYSVKAGNNVQITGDKQNPTISVDFSQAVTSLQGQTGDVQLQPGTDISIDGLTISDISTLTSVASRGDCDSCITDADVANNLTITAGGNVAGEAITSGLIATNVGGTGLSSYNTGDLIYASAANTLANLPIGSTNGQILQVQNGVPAWSTIALDAAGTSSITSGANLVGVYANLTNSSSNNLQQVLQDLDTSITSAGTSPFSTGNDLTYGTYIRPTNISDNFILGGTGTIDTSTLFFNTSTGTLNLGTNNTGAGGQNGSLTLFSSGNGVTDTGLTTNATGDLLIPNGNVGIGATPSDLDVDGHPFALEVDGSIGPAVDAVYDLGSPTRRYRDLYITGTTTSGGDITIANSSPKIYFIDTDVGQDQYLVNVDNSQFTLTNNSTGAQALAVLSNGDVLLASGSASTGCTIADATGNLTCSGNITTANTSGTVGFFSRNNGTSTLTTATAGDSITTSGNLSTTGTGTITSANGLTVAAGNITFSSFSTAGVVVNDTAGLLSTVAQLSPLRGGTGVDASTASNGQILIGNGTGFSLNTISGTPNQINVTNGAGSITLSTPQDIAATSTPTFAALTLNNVTNQLVLGQPTHTTTISSPSQAAPITASIPSLGASDTFVFANATQTLDNKTIGSTGLTFSGAATDITTAANEDLTLSPNGTGEVVISNTTKLLSLLPAPGAASTVCRDNVTNELTFCPANSSNVDLQQAYNAGNAISASDLRGNIALTLAALSSRQLTLTNAGTASSAFVINDTNAANQNAIEVQSNGSPTLTINENGNLTTIGNISTTGSGAVSSATTLTAQAATNQLVLGNGNTTTISSIAPAAARIATIPALSADDTFIFANQTQTLTNKSIGAGGLIFSGASPDITTVGNEDFTITPGGTGEIILSSTAQLGTLIAPTGNIVNTLCRDTVTHEITQCPANASNTTLQLAYDAGNTITTTTGRNIDFRLYDETSNNGIATSFSVTNAGTGSALIINDTNAGIGTALSVQSNGTQNLSINENGVLSTTGNILTTAGGTITSNGLLTASNGLTLTTGALNLTATSGTINLNGITAYSINAGGNNVIFTSNNFNTTATGINSTAIGATNPSTGNFTNLTAAGSASFSGDLVLAGGPRSIQTTENNTLTIGGNSTGNINISPLAGLGTIFLNGSATTSGNLSVYGTAQLTGNTSILGSSTFIVGTGATTLGGTLNVAGLTTLSSGVNIFGGINNNNGGITNAGPITDITYATASGSITADTVNALTALQLNGININTAGTLSNVAYQNQANIFTTDQTISGTLTLSSALTDITTGVDEDLTLSPNGIGQIVLNKTTRLESLPAAPVTATTLCRDDSTHQITQCPANAANVTLQLAYQAGNTISASDQFGDIAFTLANGSSR